ncbi:transposase [Ancylomarina sp. 16SWW S1-10-2]|uniref:transposase n=1 Tax=Ancylomarina sp. 16SWW S1-10-2 TaxID=2499681 RepID=UPI0012ADE1D2|nr:transposase [Ancylomarina sp. 16SWW S1-10-2]MRT94904.1 IS110 family transposase [Ancylomarina sp. 16SWW S1-10-2]
MKKKVFIGLDYSKLTVDATCFHIDNKENVEYAQFENTEEGFISLIEWVRKLYKDTDLWLVCGEYTGIYSMTSTYVFNDKGIDLWLENPSQIKLSCGVRREKNDKLDSYDIAMYAARFTERVRLYKPKSDHLIRLRDLVRFKDRLTKTKVALQVPAKESKSVRKTCTDTKYICDTTDSFCSNIDKQIKEIEKRMMLLLKTDPELKQMYKLITSVVGVGMQTAIYLLIHTWGFEAFDNPRQLACYCGVVPFSKQSGTSLKGKAHVSKIANRKLKSLLHMCALNAVRYDPQLKLYYQKKVEEGKHKMKVLNNVRNKLIHRIYAVITTGQEYDKNYYQNNMNIAA